MRQQRWSGSRLGSSDCESRFFFFVRHYRIPRRRRPRRGRQCVADDNAPARSAGLHDAGVVCSQTRAAVSSVDSVARRRYQRVPRDQTNRNGSFVGHLIVRPLFSCFSLSLSRFHLRWVRSCRSRPRESFAASPLTHVLCSLVAARSRGRKPRPRLCCVTARMPSLVHPQASSNPRISGSPNICLIQLRHEDLLQLRVG